MNETERRESAVDLVTKAYENPKNVDNITDELFKMSKDDRLDVIKKMEAIDKKCHEDDALKKAVGHELPHIVIVDKETPSSTQLDVKLVTQKPHEATKK